jgi:hypothetical protein
LLIKSVLFSAANPLSRIEADSHCDAVAAYIAQTSKPDKNGDIRCTKSTRSANSELEQFRPWSKKIYISELTYETTRDFRDELNLRYEPDTVYNKLLMVTTFLKRNSLPPIRRRPCFRSKSFPIKVDVPDPYTEEEFNAMLEHATYDDGLLSSMYNPCGNWSSLLYSFDTRWSPNSTPAALTKYCSSLSISTNSSGNEAISLCRYAASSR